MRRNRPGSALPFGIERLAAVLGMIFLLGPCLEASSPSDSLKAAVTNLPLYFIENRGQRDPSVAYYLEGGDTSVYFADAGINYSLSGPSGRFSVKLDFVGASPDARPEGEDRTDAVVSYFKGDRADWKTGLPTYSRLVYEDLWPGIDLVYTGEGGRLKYTFVVRPGADPRTIQLAYRGASSVRVSPEGRLSVSTPSRVLEEDVPYVYQEAGDGRVEVKASYELQAVSGGETHGFGFRVGPYDAEKPLFLDPLVLAYCGFLGGAGADQGLDIAVDGFGNAYVVGVTSSTEVSGYPGPDATANGANDAFVVKVNAAGTALIYAGYIGGAADDAAYGVAVDGSGNAYLVGVTSSTEATFPETVGPDLFYNGGVSDVFVAKLDAAGTTLLYCGYIGGTGLDETIDVAVDGSGSAYVGGSTNSTEASFPVTVGPDLTYNGGSRDLFVAKVNAAGTALVYCGYIGGTGWDFDHGIAVDGSGNAYLTGDTTSTEASFPVLVGPDLTQNGSWDVFVTKVNAAGTALVYSGFIGGSGDDLRARVDVDAFGSAYVVGVTASTEATFPVTVGPDLTYNGGTWDGFVAKVNAAGSALTYAGYIGGSGEDRVRAVALDGSNNAVVSGWTASTEATFPVSSGPDSTYNGGVFDAFVAKVNAAGTALLECGYIGGSAEDQAPGVAVDGSDNVYVTGFTISTQATFPELVGPFLTYLGGATDGFVAKMNAVTTAVELTSFEAAALDSAVELRWETGSELNNLGFHLYRSSSAEGPYERITLRLIPGLGSSPAGASYRYLDEELSNGVTYSYKLEDVETTGRTEVHGPVTATPAYGNSAGEASSVAASAFLTYGDPEATSLRVVERGARRLVLELRVGGFSADPVDNGAVRISMAGFTEASEAGSPSIPVKRSWVEIGSGRTARVASVTAEGVEEFTSLRPAPGEEPELIASPRGTVRAGRKARRPRSRRCTRRSRRGF